MAKNNEQLDLTALIVGAPAATSGSGEAPEGNSEAKAEVAEGNPEAKSEPEDSSDDVALTDAGIQTKAGEAEEAPPDAGHEIVVCPLEVLECKGADGKKAEAGKPITEVTGYGSVFNDVDSYGDVVRPGAFAKTLTERLPGGGIKFFSDHGWSSKSLLGVLADGTKEDSHGLFIRATCSQSPSAQDTLRKAQEGFIDRLSIGFRTVTEKFVEQTGGFDLRELLEVKLYEVSLVPFPALESARVLAVKGVPFAALPLAAMDHPWEPEAALERVRAWADEGKSADGALRGRTLKARGAFLWYDRKHLRDPQAYRGNVCDVVNGSLRVVPKAIFASVKALAGGGAGLVPEEAVPDARRHLERYVDRLRDGTKDPALVAPWRAKGALEILLAKRRFDVQDVGDEQQNVRNLLGLLADEDRKEVLGSKSEAAGPESTGKVDQPPTAQAPEVRTRLMTAKVRLGAMGQSLGL